MVLRPLEMDDVFSDSIFRLMLECSQRSPSNGSSVHLIAAISLNTNAGCDNNVLSTR